MLSAPRGGAAKTAENGAFYTTYAASRTTGMNPILSSVWTFSTALAGQRTGAQPRWNCAGRGRARASRAIFKPAPTELRQKTPTPSNLRATQGVELVARGAQEAER
jgi:hypothetical protein